MMTATLTPGMAALVLFGTFFFFIALRVPVAFSLGLGLVVILVVAWSIDWVFVSRVWPAGVDRLRGLRNRADYEDEMFELPREVQRAIRHAEGIITLLGTIE